jgi:hypothetical protein
MSTKLEDAARRFREADEAFHAARAVLLKAQAAMARAQDAYDAAGARLSSARHHLEEVVLARP